MVMTKGTITWLPIEDIPKDGKWYLIYGLWDDAELVKWVQGEEMWYCKGLALSDFEMTNEDMLRDVTHFAYINPPEVQDGK